MLPTGWEYRVLLESAETCLAGHVIGRGRDHAATPAAPPLCYPRFNGGQPRYVVCGLRILAANGQVSLTRKVRWVPGCGWTEQ
jgi:hypothetical protein